MSASLAPDTPLPERQRPLGIACALLVWLGATVTGFVLLETYQGRPGPTADARDWPAASRLQWRAEPTVVLFLHPQCACSRATLAELRRLLPRVRRAPAVHIVLSGDGDMLEDAARAVTGAELHRDRDTIVAKQFGATTSGHVFVFDARGRLGFHGGITGSRGHEGPNAGVDAVLAHLESRPAGVAHTPVFGCLLFESERDDV